MKITSYTIQNAHGIANFFRKIFAELGMSERPLDYMEEPHLLFHLPDNGILLIAKDENDVIGTAGAILLNNTEALIKRFYIDKNHRGSGLAQKLLKELKRNAKSRGVKKLILDVSKNNKRAIRFYEKSGFHTTIVAPRRDWPESSAPESHLYFYIDVI